MAQYIDAIVIPVPRASLDTYKRMSEEWGKAHLRHGALYYSDAISDDVEPGKVTSFPQAVELKEGEVIASLACRSCIEAGKTVIASRRP